jgi:hypothetical protein
VKVCGLMNLNDVVLEAQCVVLYLVADLGRQIGVSFGVDRNSIDSPRSLTPPLAPNS